MTLDARAATRPHDRGVRGPGRQDQAVAGYELDRDPFLADEERDRARGAHEHLRVAVVVRGVPLARAIRPGGRVDTLAA